MKAPASIQWVEMENALMSQKDRIRTFLSQAQNAAELKVVLDILALAEPVWQAVGYGYKAQEIKNDIRNKALDIRVAEEKELAGCKKGSGLHNNVQSHIEELEAIISSL